MNNASENKDAAVRFLQYAAGYEGSTEYAKIMKSYPARVDVIENEDIDLDKISGTSDMKKIKDLKGRPLLLFVNSWSVGMTLDRNEGLILSEFGRS